MKNFIVLVFILLTGCSIPQGTDSFLDDKKLSFSFEQGNDFGVIVKDANKSIVNVVNTKSYALSPKGTKFNVVKSEPYSFAAVNDDGVSEQFWVTHVYFSDDNGVPLKKITETGRWEFNLMLQSDNYSEHFEQFIFNVTKKYYIPFVMRPN